MILSSVIPISIMLASSSGLGYQCGSEVFIKTDPVTTFTMPNYFEKLSANQPNDSYGTCAYVALTSILSYADTFINDERFEQKVELNYMILNSKYMDIASAVSKANKSLFDVDLDIYYSSYKTYKVNEEEKTYIFAASYSKLK